MRYVIANKRTGSDLAVFDDEKVARERLEEFKDYVRSSDVKGDYVVEERDI